MSLGIFSFDLAALINSLSNFIETMEPITVDPTNTQTSLDKMTDVLQNVTGADSAIDDVLMATALDNVITSVISAAENVKKESSSSTIPAPKPTVRIPAVTLDEATKREIEQLIKSLQTTVVHNYKSTDIIDENVSLNNVANFPKRNIREDSDNKTDQIQDEKKREEHKLRMWQEELRKAIMKNNSDV